MFYQQGDVLIKGGHQRPIEAQQVETGNGRVVLARGEATGHAHVIERTEGVQCYTLGEILYLLVEKEVEVTHQEHGDHFKTGAGVIPRIEKTYRIILTGSFPYLSDSARYR